MAEDRFEADGVSRGSSGQIQVVKHTLEAGEQAVQGMRSEIPIGVSGQPIERVPVTEQSEMLVKTGTYVKLMGGRNICLRVVELPLQGGKSGRFHCSRLCMSVGTNQGYFCPEHDRQVFSQGNVPSGKVTNSASIHLSEGESVVMGEKDGKKVQFPLLPGRDHALTPPVFPTIKRQRKPRQPSNGPVVHPRGQIAFKLDVDGLDHLEADAIVYQLITTVINALDGLPAKSVADMKRIVAIQEKLKQFSLEEGK
jgi:hypothetical protein